MNEFALIARHFTRAPRSADVVLGVGDDAAILRMASGREGECECEWLATVDMMVEGTHFLPGTDPARLGHKILAVNLSDLAAMGARPRFALLAGALPDNDDAWLAAFARGLFALAHLHDVDVVGGDTTRGPRNLCVTLLGDAPAGTAIRRSGAREGDDVWVSGTLGDAMLALAVLQGRASLSPTAFEHARGRLELPAPRVALGQALRGVATAAVDVSDGFTGDLAHILAQSGVGASIDRSALPRSASMDEALSGPHRELALACLAAGGDDYELCFTAPPAHRARIEASGTQTGARVSRVGTITGEHGLVLRDESGAPLAQLPPAFEHFTALA